MAKTARKNAAPRKKNLWSALKPGAANYAPLSPLSFLPRAAEIHPNRVAAQDILQETNLVLCKKVSEFEPGTNFKAWAFAIARFEVLNYRKQQARDARLVFSEELEETFAEELAQQSDDLERRHAALKACLGKLREKDRALLMHRYAKKGTLDEFARAAGRSVGGLKVTLHRLRNTLLACMQKQLSNPETQS